MPEPLFIPESLQSEFLRVAYPPLAERPQSAFSVKSCAPAALESLLRRLSSRGCSVLLTFPDHQCSNGLCGRSVEAIAASHFKIRVKKLATLFSTLGGNHQHRAPRRQSREMILS